MAGGAVIGALRVNLGMNSAQFRRGATEAQQTLNRLRGQFRLAAAGSAALGAAMTGALAAGLRDVDRQAKVARSIDGTTGALRALELAAGDVGIESGQVTSSIQKLSRELANAGRESGPAADALEVLGLNAAELQTLDVDARLATIADRIQELGFSAGQAQDVLRDLGVRNAEFALLVTQGGDAIRAARNEITAFGLDLDQRGVANVEAANDSMARLGLGFEAFRNQLAIAVAPALKTLSDGFVASLKEGGRLNTAITLLGDNISLLVSISGTATAVFGARYIAAFAGMRVATTGVTLSLVAFRRALSSTIVGAVIVGLGVLVNKFVEAKNAAVNLQVAIDNNTLAMADEIAQIQLVTAALQPGTRVSIDAARAKLEQAEAILANVDALRQESIQLVKSSAEYRSLQRDLEQLSEVLAQGRAELQDNPITATYDVETLNVFEARIQEIQAQQKLLVDQAGEITPEYREAESELQRIRQAIANAVDGMVTFSGEVTRSVDISARLQANIGGINFSRSVSGAQALAAQLGITLQRALQLQGLVGAAAQAASDPVVFDPRDPRFDADAAAAASNLERIREQMQRIQEETAQASTIPPAFDQVANSAGGAAGSLEEVGDVAEETAAEMSGPLSSAVDGLSQAFADFTLEGLNDFKSFAQSIRDLFRALLRDLIAQAARNQIAISLGFNGTGGGIGTSLTGGLLNGGGGLGGLLGIGAAGLSAGFGSVISGISSGFSASGVVGAITGGIQASVGSITQGLLVGGAGGIGAAIGAAIPVIGGALLIGGLFSGLFGRKKRKPIISNEDFRAVQVGLTLTGQELLSTGRAGQRAARSLKNLAGGAEEFTTLTEGYFANFFSDTERRALAIDGLRATFEGLGLELPTTARGFRDTVEGLDLMTASGRRTYTELLKVSDSFAQVYGSIEDVNRTLDQFQSGNIFGSIVEEQLARAALARGADLRILQSAGGVIDPRSLVTFSGGGLGADPTVTSAVTLKQILNLFERWEAFGLPPTEGQ